MQPQPSEIKYTSDMYDALIVFQTDENNKIQVIMCSLPTSSLSTAKKAISMMGMVATGTNAADTKLYFNDDNDNNLQVLER